jgi:hypothetical protein
MMLKVLLNGKQLNGQILTNIQVQIETSILLRAIKTKMMLDKHQNLHEFCVQNRNDSHLGRIGMSEERGRPDRRIRTDRRKYDRQTESEQTDAGRTDRRNWIKQDADRSQTR